MFLPQRHYDIHTKSKRYLTFSIGTLHAPGTQEQSTTRILLSLSHTIAMADNLDDRMSKFHNDANALATDLIALLDRFIFLEGYTLTTHPVQPEVTLPPIPSDDTPIAVQMYAAPSLSAQLENHDQELREKSLLVTRIATLVKKTSVSQAANALLDAEFASLPDTLTPKTTTYKSLTSKLATLRERQQRATQPPPPPEFKTHIVTALDDPGFASPFTKIYLPYTISWSDYVDLLRNYTRHLLVEGDGDDDVAGSTMPEGKWYYQRFLAGRQEGSVQELGCEVDFRRLKREARKEGVGVRVWNVSLLLLVTELDRAWVASRRDFQWLLIRVLI